MKVNARTVTLTALLTALALALSLMERLFPVSALIGVPGVKLGLSNVVVMFALVMLGTGWAAGVVCLKSLLLALFSGFSSLLFSLAGGLLALCAMALLRRVPLFSLYGVSIGGAFMHNVGQCLVAWLTLGDAVIFAYLPLLTLTGVACGFLTALAALPAINAAERTGFFAKSV